MERLQRKIEAIERRHARVVDADREINATLDAQELLTTGLLPTHSPLRTRVVSALLRTALAPAETMADEEEDFVPVEVHGGGKCKMTILMTRAAARAM